MAVELRFCVSLTEAANGMSDTDRFKNRETAFDKHGRQLLWVCERWWM